MARRIVQVILITFASLSLPSPAQSSAGPVAGGQNCRSAPDFAVKTAIAGEPVQPQAGRALVYFFASTLDFPTLNREPVVRFSVESDWLGAARGGSYFYFFVEPGVRHLCASVQPAVFYGSANAVAAAHFVAEAGKVYSFEAVATAWWRDNNSTFSLTLGQMDSDEGELLRSSYEFATWQVKKKETH